MIGNQVVSSMFDIKKIIRMVRIVSVRDWNEYLEHLGIIIKKYLSSGCDEAFGSLTWIHIVCLVAVFNV